MADVAVRVSWGKLSWWNGQSVSGETGKNGRVTLDMNEDPGDGAVEGEVYVNGRNHGTKRIKDGSNIRVHHHE